MTDVRIFKIDWLSEQIDIISSFTSRSNSESQMVIMADNSAISMEGNVPKGMDFSMLSVSQEAPAPALSFSVPSVYITRPCTGGRIPLDQCSLGEMEISKFLSNQNLVFILSEGILKTGNL